MCGIAGIFDLGSGYQPARAELERMVAQLRHRGPDGDGFYTARGLGLAHARLSIIDLAGGWQPIHNETKTVWVVFNGEIFNYVELREELERRGHHFYTHSDTEVLVHLYEEYGDGFVARLNGQFAIALWDEPARRLLLIRDRPGILPLFYTRDRGRLLFGSEVKAMLAVMSASPTLSHGGLDQLMTFWAPQSPNTIFEGVFEVSPGEMLVVTDGGLERRRYWDWTFPEDGQYRAGSEASLAEELRAVLIDATRIRLRADVPVGAYLSGGLDSSILTAVIHRHGGARLRTFSIGFSDEGLDESEFQQEMIRHLNTEHSAIHCRGRDVGERFVEAVWSAESPMLRTAPVPMGMLSGLVRKHDYRVVLTGEGADEVFGGYDLFKEFKIRRFWARQPQSRRRPTLLKRLYPYLDLSQRQTQTYLESFFGIGLDNPDSPNFSHLTRWDTTARCKDFLTADFRAGVRGDPIAAMVDALPMGMARWHPFNRAQYLEAKTLMAGYLLASQGDRMLMSNSVEGRFPYLDHRVIEFANSLDPRLKMKVLQEKYLLRQAFSGYLPAGVRARHKQPYRAPDIAAFYDGSVPSFVGDLLSPETIRRYGYFDAAKVQRLVNKAAQNRAIGFKDNMAYVGVLSTQVWHHLFIETLGKRLAPGVPMENGGSQNFVVRR